jgi:Skp family chaperone for outer membrane proteins
VLLSSRCLALEVSLEENRAERGNIGYVDLQKIFKLFPETRKAKESFQEIVRQAEEQINTKKSELLALRAEISKLTLEYELLQKTPIPATPPQASTSSAPSTPAVALSTPSIKTPTPIVSTPPVSISSPTLSVSTSMAVSKEIADSSANIILDAATGRPVVSISTSTLIQAATAAMPSTSVEGPKITTAPAREVIASLPGLTPATTALPAIPPLISQELEQRSGQSPLIINLPGATTGPVPLPPLDERPTLSVSTSPAIALSTAAASVPMQIAPSTAPAAWRDSMPGPAQSVASQLAKTRLQELEEILAMKKKNLGQKESEFKEHQAQVEKNLLDLESRRTEILLGKIYAVVQEVARENGVSVVVDKSQILFGHTTVDLTGKVIKKLETLPL